MEHPNINRPPCSGVCPKCGVSLPTHVAAVCPVCLIDSIDSHSCLFGGQDLRFPYQLGDYRLLSKLGEGGMGVVFEAEHTGSGRRLALKILKEFAGDERERQRFLREGELASTIDHPHSVYLFGTEEIDGLLVISMELATAGTLRDEVARRGPLPVHEAVDRILEVLSALELAHSKGVLHRDIKPSNCFLGTENRTLIGDYGLSISPLRHPASEPLTQTGAFIGTPSYCAPEQIRGMALDPRADFYSLAGTLYFLLSGKSPMEAYTPLEAIAAALEGRIPSIRELRPDVPPALAAVLSRALDPDRENRFQDHAAFRQALLPWSSQAPTPAPLGVRFLAGLTDFALLGLGFAVARGFRVAAQQTSTSLTPYSTNALIVILLLSLWVLLECLSGGSPGKWLLGLRLATAGGGKARAAKVLLRAAVFAGMLTGAFLLWLSVGRGFLSLTVDYGESVTYEWSSIEGGRGPLLIIPFTLLHLLSAPLYLYLALFQRISRHPEHAARHDRLSGIRVVLRSLYPMRQTVPEALEGLPLDWTSFSETWGPIQVGPALENGLRVGIDPVLHRRVFLEKRTTAFPEARRWCARTSRLRWLQSVRDGEGTLWEVWQAPSGSPLTALTAATPIPWTTMLDWMRQVAREIREAANEGTLPEPLGLGHVWITPDYRALLLDTPWERPAKAEDAPHSSLSPSPIQACQHLLFEMMQACPHWERPLHSDPLLASLQNASIERFTHILGLLNALRKKKPALSKKVGDCLALVPFLLLPALSAFNGYVEHSRREKLWAREFPSLPPLPRVLNEMGAFHPARLATPEPGRAYYKRFTLTHETVIPLVPFWSFFFRVTGRNSSEGTALSTHVRGHYGALFNDTTNLEKRALQLPEIDLHSVMELLASTPNQPAPDTELLAAADRQILEALQKTPRLLGIPVGLPTQQLVLSFNAAVETLLLAAASFQLLCILVLGNPLLTRLTRTTFVSQTQRPAGRMQMLARWALVWIPTCGIEHALQINAFNHMGLQSALPQLITAALLPQLIAGTSLFPRNRCLLDRLTGIWKVQR